MSYQANLLKEVKQNHVYRHKKNGRFYLVSGFCKMKLHDGTWEDGVSYYPVEYINITPQPKHQNKMQVGLRVVIDYQRVPFVRRDANFRDRFFLHHTDKQRPKIVSIVTLDGNEVPHKSSVDGDHYAN